jgi:uncharacterized membrane protein YccC
MLLSSLKPSKFSYAILRRLARTLLGALIAYGAARLATLPELYWAVITALVVVTQPSLNAALTTGRDQISGAAIGGIAGGIGILAILQGAPPLLVFAIELAPLAALAAWRPTLRLACVTLVVVVLIPATGGTGSPFERPVDRVFEILIGAAAAIVASFLLPNRAINAAHDRASDIVLTLGELIALYLTRAPEPGEAERLNRKAVTMQQALDDAITEAGREHIIVPLKRTPGNVVDKLGPLLRRLHRDALFLGPAFARDPDAANRSARGGALALASQAFAHATQTLASALDSDRAQQTENIALARAAFEQLQRDVGATCSSMEKNAVLPFVLNLLVQDLGEMVTTTEARDDQPSVSPV